MNKVLYRYRPTVKSVTVCAATTLYLLLVTNWTFWTRAFGYLAKDHFAFILFAVGISAMSMAIITAFSAKYVTRIFLIFFILTASAASWFTDQFGVVVDREMIRNAAVSTGAEAGHLLTLRFATHLLMTGLLPSLVVVWVRIAHRPFLAKLAHNSAIIAGCIGIFALAAACDYRTFAGVGRAHRDILDPLNPFFPISSAVRFIIDATQNAEVTAQPLGVDAHRAGLRPKPRVTVIVAGETARADDFSLGGYARDTNPELRERGVVYFPNTTSCGTSTAVSIPCMFSVYPRRAYTHRKGLETENVLDVLTHANVSVSWFDNDTGSYHVTDRVAYQFLPSSADARFCKDGECLDAILLDRMDSWLGTVKGDSVLILHQLGSHGPAYFSRYPNDFRHFLPDCRANDFGACSAQEIKNAYDNTILYTDHIVSQVIDRLKARSSTIAGSVIYLSDHGESLGEHGLYLHGAPYVFAPSQQTHVPFLVWIADDLQRAGGFDMGCLDRNAALPNSHDNLFHSVLGLMDVSTTVYDPALDIFAKCRRPGTNLADARQVPIAG
ncbi:sulfatase protein (plasmid) [Rhizobium gallicum bv. gallicum R602sp]|uniref:Sulfatase protein n=1 Tax=Rhizobium gallicum bv. gallicum R602sp TaxID=1041138 RepID=A0A0B4XHI9_9HYPH|nr:phosphoethanolamine--lipid A transferase [Rhizobium gallicum]AJD45897.1 sulfatase protein [Rhizobium gallicum bv. gallicum R602sp]TDW32200.1 phosphatidylethanolamine:Kdo2-lipid A phosphoethanolamine transferase [Rhizobium azibense]